MKYEIWFSPRSREEILEVFEYIRSDQQSPLNAARWLDGMMQATSNLAEFPHAHGLARENDAFKEELRQYVFKSHRIIFDVMGNRVRIHRVVHVARENIDTDPMSNLTPKT